MKTFFKSTPEIYESIRNLMDSQSGYPNGNITTWFNPSADAPKDVEGNCLICCIPQIASYFSLSATEISEEEYFASVNPPSEFLNPVL
jgi:hypothetical protein